MLLKKVLSQIIKIPQADKGAFQMIINPLQGLLVTLKTTRANTKKVLQNHNKITPLTFPLEVRLKPAVIGQFLRLTVNKKVQGHRDLPGHLEVQGHHKVQDLHEVQGHLKVQGQPKGQNQVTGQGQGEGILITAGARTQTVVTGTGVTSESKQHLQLNSLPYHQALVLAWQQVAHDSGCSMLTLHL